MCLSNPSRVNSLCDKKNAQVAAVSCPDVLKVRDHDKYFPLDTTMLESGKDDQNESTMEMSTLRDDSSELSYKSPDEIMSMPLERLSSNVWIRGISQRSIEIDSNEKVDEEEEEKYVTTPPITFGSGSKKQNHDNKQKQETQQQEPGYTDKDVLFGRGGRTNRHPGNIKFRKELENIRQWYIGCKTKQEKSRISKLMIDWIHSNGGRFLVKDDTEKWVAANSKVVRKKVNQAIRDTKSTRKDDVYNG